jgi:hypothetical protein
LEIGDEDGGDAMQVKSGKTADDGDATSSGPERRADETRTRRSIFKAESSQCRI